VAIHKLTASRVAKLTANGMYGDGGNLWLQVTGNGAGKSWIFRWTERGTGRERNIGLGPYHTVDLDRAREFAKGYRLMLLEGKDPKAERDTARLDIQIAAGVAMTVSQVAEKYFEQKIARKSPKYRKDTEDYLKKYVHNKIGNMPIQKVDRNTILETCGLRALWVKNHETGLIVQRHLARMFRLAIACKHYTRGENPAAWKDGLEHVLAPSADVHRVKHREGPSRLEDVPKIMQLLRSYQDRARRNRPRSTVPFLIEFVWLSGVRSGEARLATWKEIDKKRMIWNVPWQHLKMGRVYRTDRPVPITKPMLAIIEKMEERRLSQSNDALVFPAHNKGRGPMSPPVPTNFLRGALRWETKLTVHGFRDAFKNWCRANRFPETWSEIQLDHALGDKTQQAYGRDKLVEERRGMMELWGEFCSRPPAPEPQSADIVKLADKKRRA
jgi:integrase